MTTEAIERVIRESSASSPETLAAAVDQLRRVRIACRSVFLHAASTGEEQEAVELLTAIGNEADE